MPIIDAGCGEGYYSMFPAREGYSVLGCDLSKFAVDAASKRAVREGIDNAFFVAASVFSLPVADGSVGAILNIFAPCAEEEYRRALSDNGTLVVAWAGENHLMGLKKALYDVANTNQERADLPKNMIKTDEERLSFTVSLESSEQIQSLFSMTPYYWRTSPTDAQRVMELEHLTTEIDIMLSVYKNN